MFDMFVREYFDNSLIPLSDTIEAFVFRRDNIVQAGNRTATRISRVQFGIRMLLVIQNLPDRSQSLYSSCFPESDISYRYLHLPST